MMENDRLMEKLHELESTTSNYALQAFCTEVVNCILELKNDLQEIDGLRERIERLEDNANSSAT